MSSPTVAPSPMSLPRPTTTTTEECPAEMRLAAVSAGRWCVTTCSHTNSDVSTQWAWHGAMNRLHPSESLVCEVIQCTNVVRVGRLRRARGCACLVFRCTCVGVNSHGHRVLGISRAKWDGGCHSCGQNVLNYFHCAWRERGLSQLELDQRWMPLCKRSVVIDVICCVM